MANLTENKIGERAQKMLERSLRSEIRNSGLNLSSENSKNRKNKKLQPLTPLRKTTAHKRMLKNDKQLFGIAIHLGKHGFVHNFGATSRESSNVVSNTGKHFTRKASRFNLPAKKYINRAISKSGVVSYLSSKISEVRGEEIVSKIKGVFR